MIAYDDIEAMVWPWPAALDAAFADGIRPEPDVTIAEWAELHRWVSAEGSSSVGPWRNDKTPYLRAIMDDLSPSSRVEKVVFEASAQVGKTECGNNFVAFIMANGLGSILVVQGNNDLAKKYSKKKIAPMIRDNPCLRERVRETRERDSGNTVLDKEFPGGSLTMVGAQSPGDLGMLSMRFVMLDELDRHPDDVGGEGSSVKLAEARSSNFPRRKIYICSTPTGIDSKIHKEFEKTDQRRYYVPCPHCGHMQVLKFREGLRFDSKLRGAAFEESVFYACEAHGCVITERYRTGMLAGGEWRPTAEPERPHVHGYHINAMYSPWTTWVELAREFVEVHNDRQQLKAFVNTKLGEIWKDATEVPDWKRLYQRRGPHTSGVVPMGGCFLTAAADVQHDRIEVEVVAWGPEWRRWGVEYLILSGNTQEEDVWRRLEALLHRSWPHQASPDAQLSLLRLAVDASDRQNLVLARTRTWPQDRFMAVKGRAQQDMILTRPATVDIDYQGRKWVNGAQLWSVGVSTCKFELYGWLRAEGTAENPPPGWITFPVDYDPEYFEQLCSEQVVRERVNGVWKRRWKQLRPRNEALDIAVYNRAAAHSVGLDRWTPEQWEQVRVNAGLTAGPHAPQRPPERQGGGRFSGRVNLSGWRERDDE